MPGELGYPLVRLARPGPEPTPGPTPDMPVTPRMRVFPFRRSVLAAGVQFTHVTPRISGPAVIVSVWVGSEQTTGSLDEDLLIHVSENDTVPNGEVALGTAIDGVPITERMTNPATPSADEARNSLHMMWGTHGGASLTHTGEEHPINYLVDLPSFFVKLTHIGNAVRVDGHIRVLEGVDPARFF